MIYIPSSANSESKKKEIKDTIAAQKGDANIELEDILPYLKNSIFFEEKESRMVFSNIDGRLSKCIHFRILQNGVKVPYIIVKAGNIGKCMEIV